MNEEMKDVFGFENSYSISNKGRLWSKKRKHYLKPYIGEYETITLYNKEKTENTSIHRIVATAFIENVDNKPFVNHIDGNKLNNDVSNLEWVTPSENMLHAFEIGIKKPSTKQREFARVHAKTLCEKTKKKVKQLTKKGELVMIHKSIREASRKVGVKHPSIIAAIKRNGMSAGFKWEVA